MAQKRRFIPNETILNKLSTVDVHACTLCGKGSNLEVTTEKRHLTDQNEHLVSGDTGGRGRGKGEGEGRLFIVAISVLLEGCI